MALNPIPEHVWQPGDLAECIIGYPGRLVEGQVYPVMEVTTGYTIDLFPSLPSGTQKLKLLGVPAPSLPRMNAWWKSCRFRPYRPSVPVTNSKETAREST